MSGTRAARPLADSIPTSELVLFARIEVLPVCPFVARHPERHADLLYRSTTSTVPD